MSGYQRRVLTVLLPCIFGPCILGEGGESDVSLESLVVFGSTWHGHIFVAERTCVGSINFIE